MDGAVLHGFRKESWYGLQGLWPSIDMGWLQEVLKLLKHLLMKWVFKAFGYNDKKPLDFFWTL